MDRARRAGGAHISALTIQVRRCGRKNTVLRRQRAWAEGETAESLRCALQQLFASPKDWLPNALGTLPCHAPHY